MGFGLPMYIDAKTEEIKVPSNNVKNMLQHAPFSHTSMEVYV